MTHLLEMSESVTQLLISSPPPFTPQPNSSSTSKISPTVLLVILIVAVIFFVSGILHLLVRFFVKRPSYSQPIRSRNNNNTNAEALQRQLQQLFRLHDSGLDQPLIDALPVFFYKDIMGLKEPFDCAVCLCKFSDDDKLRLLPLCSHAFHVSCIDTWLLSNSTCPLCRGSLLCHGLENQEFSLDYWREMSFGRSINSDYDNANNGHSFNYGHKPSIMEENASERRVFSVRLGKFKSINDDHKMTRERKNKENSIAASSSGNSGHQLDARRCYSLGSYQYVLDNVNLEVPLSAEIGANSGVGGDIKLGKPDGSNEDSAVNCDVEGKKISSRNGGDSFSVSKIWLWSSKKGNFPGSSESVGTSNGANLPTNVVLPLSNRDRIPH